MTGWVGTDDTGNDPTVVTGDDVTLGTHTGGNHWMIPSIRIWGVPAADMFGCDCPAVTFTNPAISWDTDGIRL